MGNCPGLDSVKRPMRSRGAVLAIGLMATVAVACNGEADLPSTTIRPPAESLTTQADPTTTTIAATTSTSSVDLTEGGPQLTDAPSTVADREPLPYCGAELMEGFGNPNPYSNIELTSGASECYYERVSSGLPAELILVGTTIEGDPVMYVLRVLPDRSEVTFIDATQDDLGAGAWVMIECGEPSDPDQSNETCSDGVVLDG